MGSEKKKGSAEASANPKQDKYNKLRERTQAETHVRDLVDYLYRNKSITSYECFQLLNNTRISSTVSILRHDYGVPVVTDMIEKDGKRYGVYSIDWGCFDV